MKITIESTSKVVMLNAIMPARIWEGETESGIKVHCFITRIACNKNEKNKEEFEKELQSVKPPSTEIDKYPMRLIL
jgi:hypothetical protein